MTYEQVKELHPGDEVYWNDPDDGECSDTYQIREVRLKGDIVQIWDTSGRYLECFSEELS